MQGPANAERLSGDADPPAVEGGEGNAEAAAPFAEHVHIGHDAIFIKMLCRRGAADPQLVFELRH